MWAQHLQMFWLTKSPKPKYIQVRKAAKRHIWEVRTRECLVTRLIALSTNHFTYTHKYFPQSFVFNSICLVWLYWCFFLRIFKQMDFLFGKRKTPEEMLRQNQRALNRAMRELDRERMKLEQQEKKIIADIKKMAKQGQMVWRTRTCVLWAIRIYKERKNPNCDVCRFNLRRTPSRSWPRIWFARGATSRSSSWWKPTFRLSVWRYRRSSPTTAWHRLWKESPKPWRPWTDRSVRKSLKYTTRWKQTISLLCSQAYISSFSAAETASDSEDHDGVWATEWNHGHERRDDEWRYRRRHGWWGRWGGEVRDWEERQDCCFYFFIYILRHICVVFI